MTRVLLALVLTAGALAVTAAGSRAAVPDTTIKAWQASAAEALEVTILSVKSEKHEQPVAGQPNCIQTREEITMTAKVDVVHRSASRMQPGRTITLLNSVLRTGPCALPGGSFGERFNAGDRVAAWLRPAGTTDGAFIANDLKKLP